jgi:hypothetical protein
MEEIWKKHEDFDDYEFSNYGRFRKSNTKKILKNTADDKSSKTKKGGYIITFLKNTKLGVRKRVRIHRMVAKLFVHNPNPLEYTVVNHIDGDKINNHYTNLEWVTVTENNKHAIMNKLSIIIQKLTEDNVREIRQDFLNDLYSVKELSEKYDVSTSTIIQLINYKTWKSVDADLCESYLTLIENKTQKNLKNIFLK